MTSKTYQFIGAALIATLTLAPSQALARKSAKSTTSSISTIHAPSKRGIQANLQLAGAAPFGDGKEGIGTGFRFGLGAGYAMHLATIAQRALTVTPGLWFGYATWGGKQGLSGYGTWMLGVGAQADYQVWGPVSAFTAMHLGGGGVTQNQGSGFALNWQVGANYQIMKYVGAGFFTGVTRTFLSGNGKPSAAGVDFGLAIRGTLAL